MHQDVFEFEIPVQEVFFVHMLESPDHIRQNIYSMVEFENFFLLFGLIFSEISLIAELHYQIQFLLCLFVLDQFDDVLVLKIIHDCNLIVDILHQFCSALPCFLNSLDGEFGSMGIIGKHYLPKTTTAKGSMDPILLQDHRLLIR